MVWDEAHKLMGIDPDVHRRDLWETIEAGAFPEYELGVQIMEEDDQLNYDFDPLDATKIWPEELFPVQRIGKLVLNRNPDNFTAETEVVAFHTGNVVPGIDFSDDPLLHGRSFSYLDTQLTRLGGPNFSQLPINQPLAPVNNNNQDGFGRFRNRKGRVNYEPSSLDGGDPQPVEASPEQGGFVSYPSPVQGPKVRQRSATFGDHYSQAAMFYRSQTPVEQEHIIEALRFELGKVETKAVRERMVAHLARIDTSLAAMVAPAVGVKVSDGIEAAKPARRAPETSILANVIPAVKGSRVAILAADGVDPAAVLAMKTALQGEGAIAEVVGPHLGELIGQGGTAVPVDKSLNTVASVMYDAVYLPGGESVNALAAEGKAVHLINEAFKHAKPIAADGAAVQLLLSTAVSLTATGEKPDAATLAEQGVATETDAANPGRIAEQFIAMIGKGRFFNRAMKDAVPA